MSASQGTSAGAASIIRCPNCQKKNRVRPERRGTPRCAACHEPLPWLVSAGAESFDDEARASVPVLVDLWAPWCGPCRMMEPTLEQLARDRAGRLKIVKVNVDDSPAIAQRYQVHGIPLLVLLRDGGELARMAGAAPAPALRAWLDAQLGGDGADGDGR
jgi:thioredoxin 2